MNSLNANRQQDLEQSKCEFSDFFWSYNSNLAVYFIVLIYLHSFSEMVSRHPKLIPVNILMQGQQDLEQSKCEFSDFFTFSASDFQRII